LDVERNFQNEKSKHFGARGAWNISSAKKPDANFLSEAARTSDDAAHLVVTRRKNAFLMMNRYPYALAI